MYVFYSVSLVLLTSVFKVVCGEQDVCAEWSRSDSLMGLSGYPGRYVDDEKLCQRMCIADDKCDAITWTPTDEVQCNFHKAQDSSTNYSPGSTHWKLKRAGKCRVDCSDSIQSADGSVTVPSARIFKASHTFLSCKRECIARDNCYAFEWWPNKAAGLGCYLQYDIGFTRSASSNSNVTIFTIGRPWCKEPIDTKNVVSGACAVWRKTLYAKGDGGLIQPHIDNEEVCRKVCMVFDFCEAVSWVQQDAQCYLHREKNYFGITWHAGSVYWELQKLRKCRVDCAYAISARRSTGFDQSPPVFKAADTFPACKTECLAKPQCSGFEWRPAGAAGQKCFPQFMPRSKTQNDAQSTIYDFERPSCIEPVIKDGVPQEPKKTSDISIDSPPIIGKPLEDPTITTTTTVESGSTPEETVKPLVRTTTPAPEKTEAPQIIVKQPGAPEAEAMESDGSAKPILLLAKIIGGVAAVLLIGVIIFIVFIRKKVVPIAKEQEKKEEKKEAKVKNKELKREGEKENPARMYGEKKNTRRQESRMIQDKKKRIFNPLTRGAREKPGRRRGGGSPSRGYSSMTPSRVGRRRNDTEYPIMIVSERHNNNPSMASTISERRNSRPNTTSEFTENMVKKPKSTSLMKELQEKSAQTNRTMARGNITRHNMTSTKTPSNHRYTETLEMTPLRSKAKDSILAITSVEQSRSESQENTVKHNIAKIDTPSYKPDAKTLETTPLIVKSTG